MAKLYGTADPTLVKMAYAESMANVPLDLSSVYKQREQNIKDFATGVSSIMDSIYKDYNDSIDNATTEGQDVDDILTMEGGIFNDAWILENDNAVKGLKDRLTQLDPRKGGDEERAAIGRELQKYKNTMASSQEIFSNLLANSANGSLLGDLKDNGELELWNTILGDIKNNTNNSNAKYENGEMTFSLGDKKMTMSDLNKALTANDPAYSANFQKNHINTLASLATKRQGNITPNDIAIWKNNATKGIISWDQVRILENEKFGKSPYTFRDVLHGQAKNPITGEVDTGALRILYDALDNIGGVDMNNDGTINKTDADMYRSSENGAKLIEELKKDKGKYTELMVGYFGETVIKDHWEQGAALRKAQTTGGGRGGSDTKNLFQGYEWIQTGNKKITGNAATKLYDDIIAQKRVVHPLDGSVYNWKDDGWYNEKQKRVAKNNNELVEKELQIMDARFYGPSPVSIQGGNRFAINNPITDYEKRDGKWYYIKGGKNIPVDKINYELLEAKAKIAQYQ